MRHSHFARLACALAMSAAALGAKAAPVAELRVTEAETAAFSPAMVEFGGVSAGEFAPALWEANTLNWVPDARSPMLEPKPGKSRNIYAPSAVQVAEGWRLFYGAWDGTDTGNDRIYSAMTKDFSDFSDRHTVIEHGKFQHVCNVNALSLPSGGFAMVCTAYPDAKGLNKPAFFSSPDGKTWNGSPEPCVARTNHIVRIAGYDKYEAADINGMNVILREGDAYRLYFSSFSDFGKVYRASGTDGMSYTFEQKALSGKYAVNDVKKFVAGQDKVYLMGLHMNTDRLWYSLSRDGLNFASVKPLFERQGDADRYIVAIGWVVSGEQESPGRRVLGALYGAGASPGLAENRIFARWLQKKVVVAAPDGPPRAGAKAIGPDRQLLAADWTPDAACRVRLFAEDGATTIAESGPVRLPPGKAYRLSVSVSESKPSAE